MERESISVVLRMMNVVQGNALGGNVKNVDALVKCAVAPDNAVHRSVLNESVNNLTNV